ncbi:MAG: dihydrolipoyl dehydrogenase [Muribaculaceae bacterium]|nr:dihydrolipoyl dehydrogenase [Muribaculaceae bacterium]
MEAVKSDLIVIGSGPGGYETAAEACHAGLKVTLIEKGHLGGTCLNRGCIPTKVYCHAAELINSVGQFADYGLLSEKPTLDFARAAAKKDEVVTQLRQGVALVLDGVNIVEGEAVLVDQSTVKVGETHYVAPNVIIATGSVPSSLPIAGADKAMTSDDLLSMTELPDSMIIIGGGVIGIEFANILNAFGVKVTVIEYCKEILPPFDKDIAKRLRTLLTRRGIKFITSAQVTEITSEGVVYESKGKQAVVDGDKVLMAVGRRAVMPAGTDTVGIETGKRGIIVDNNMRTNVDGIYAIGDVNGLCQLAHAATAQGKVALAAILGKESDVNLGIVPSAVYTTPELAMTGLTEEAAAGRDIEVLKAMFRSNGKSLTMGETDGLVKLIVDKPSGKIIGCHIIGPHASDLVQEVSTGMTLGLTLDQLKNAIHGHPTLSEILVAVR